ncbi:MAG: hypothetical protein IPO60_18135 [Flavobacteriales bacterium]|nr:hypothetical protein [Flavobacteriales bacterium]
MAQRLKKALVGIDGVKDLLRGTDHRRKISRRSIKRDELGRYGLTVDDVNAMVETAIGAAHHHHHRSGASGSA